MKALTELAARYGGRVASGPDEPVLVFDRALSDEQFRGWQRALRGRYRIAWEGLGVAAHPSGEAGDAASAAAVTAERPR